jgi:hypothetical protein
MKVTACIAFLIVTSAGVWGTLSNYLSLPSERPLKRILRKADRVEIINRSGYLYRNFDQSFAEPILKRFIDTIDISEFDSERDLQCFCYSNPRFNFYKGTNLLTTVGYQGNSLSWEEWNHGVMTPESKKQLDTILSEIGLPEPGFNELLVSASDIPAARDILFRKEPSSQIPYVLDNTAFILPNEEIKFGVEIKDNQIERITFNYTQEYPQCLEVKLSSSDVEIYNNTHFDVGFYPQLIMQEGEDPYPDFKKIKAGSSISGHFEEPIQQLILTGFCTVKITANQGIDPTLTGAF